MAVLVEEAEGTLLRLVALAGQVLQGLATGGLLAAADDATVLVLDQVCLGEATGGVLGGAVVNLGLVANSDRGGHLIFRGQNLIAESGRKRNGRSSIGRGRG